jgi:Protein of unknown function, DUF481
MRDCSRLAIPFRPTFLSLFAQSLVCFCLGAAASAVERVGSPPVATQQQACPDRVILKGGDVIRGTIVVFAEGALTIDHPDLGRLILPLTTVRSYGPAEPPAGDEEPASAPAAPLGPDVLMKPAGDDAKVTAVLPSGAPTASTRRRKTGEWQTHLAFALAGNFAANDEFTMRAGIGAQRESERTKTTLDAEYYYRVFENTTTDNNILVRGLEEWNLGDSPWLFFAQGQYQYDEFQPWTHRVSTYFGPGYRVFDTDDLGLTLRLGAGATYEAGSVHRWEPEVLLAEEFRWSISRRQQLMFNASIAPNVEDLSDYRVQSSAEYRLLLDEARRGLSLTAGLRDIFLSRPAPTAEANELRVYAGLRYDF